MKKYVVIIVFLYSLLILYAQTPEWLWAKRAGSAVADAGYAIVTDADGNSYVTGYFNDSADFGTTTLTSIGNDDVFVAKLGANGNWLWATRGGGTSGESARSISLDGNGNCYITGSFNNSTTFGTTTLSNNGSSDIFVAKLDTNGNWLWAVSAGGTSYDNGLDISTDSSGNSFVTGYYNNGITFGATTLTNSGAYDVFVCKLDTGGNWLWASSAIGASSEQGNGIVVDSNGNSYVTGIYSNTATFGTTALIGAGYQDTFVAKLDSGGNWIWAASAGGSGGYATSNDISVDSNGNSYVTGNFNGEVNFGTTNYNSPGNYDIFTAQLNSSGQWVWAKRVGSGGADYGIDISTESDGNSCITGHFEQSVNFGSIPLVSEGDADIYVARIDSGGNWLWAVHSGGSDDNYGLGISLDGNGNSYTTGYFHDTISFDTAQLASAGGSEIFVAKLSAGGTAIDDDTVPGISGSSSLYNVFPNPLLSGQMLNIKSVIDSRETGILSVYNIKGQCIECRKLNPGIQETKIDSRSLASGIYFYQLKTQTVNEVKKLVIFK